MFFLKSRFLVSPQRISFPQSLTCLPVWPHSAGPEQLSPPRMGCVSPFSRSPHQAHLAPLYPHPAPLRTGVCNPALPVIARVPRNVPAGRPLGSAPVEGRARKQEGTEGDSGLGFRPKECLCRRPLARGPRAGRTLVRLAVGCPRKGVTSSPTSLQQVGDKAFLEGI